MANLFRGAAWLLLATLPASTSLAAESTHKFFFNAFFTQAYGETDGGKVLGLDTDGTFDYRNAAILGRYELTPNNRFVLQLSHERIGASPLGDIRDDIEIDWAFYEHRFRGGYQARIGRVPIPFGVYNEIRDVGSLLEFYRPPVGIYFEGAFSAESVDGVVLSKHFFEDHPWSLEVDLYAGTWERAEFLSPIIYDGDAKDAKGAQLWLQTPVAGLKVGAAFQRFNQEDGATFLRHPDSSRFDTYLLSVDANLERLVLRAEGQWIETSFSFAPKADIPAYYALAGWRFTEQFEAYVMFETSYSKGEFGPGLTFRLDPTYEDRALTMIYRFNSHALIRVEAHHYETSSPDQLLPPDQATAKTDFAILSFSLSY